MSVFKPGPVETTAQDYARQGVYLSDILNGLGMDPTPENARAVAPEIAKMVQEENANRAARRLAGEALSNSLTGIQGYGSGVGSDLGIGKTIGNVIGHKLQGPTNPAPPIYDDINDPQAAAFKQMQASPVSHEGESGLPRVAADAALRGLTHDWMGIPGTVRSGDFATGTVRKTAGLVGMAPWLMGGAALGGPGGAALAMSGYEAAGPDMTPQQRLEGAQRGLTIGALMPVGEGLATKGLTKLVPGAEAVVENPAWRHVVAPGAGMVALEAGSAAAEGRPLSLQDVLGAFIAGSGAHAIGGGYKQAADAWLDRKVPPMPNEGVEPQDVPQTIGAPASSPIERLIGHARPSSSADEVANQVPPVLSVETAPSSEPAGQSPLPLPVEAPQGAPGSPNPPETLPVAPIPESWRTHPKTHDKVRAAAQARAVKTLAMPPENLVQTLADDLVRENDLAAAQDRRGAPPGQRDAGPAEARPLWEHRLAVLDAVEKQLGSDVRNRLDAEVQRRAAAMAAARPVGEVTLGSGFGAIGDALGATARGAGKVLGKAGEVALDIATLPARIWDYAGPTIYDPTLGKAERYLKSLPGKAMAATPVGRALTEMRADLVSRVIPIKYWPDDMKGMVQTALRQQHSDELDAQKVGNEMAEKAMPLLDDYNTQRKARGMKEVTKGNFLALIGTVAEYKGGWNKFNADWQRLANTNPEVADQFKNFYEQMRDAFNNLGVMAAADDLRQIHEQLWQYRIANGISSERGYLTDRSSGRKQDVTFRDGVAAQARADAMNRANPDFKASVVQIPGNTPEFKIEVNNGVFDPGIAYRSYSRMREIGGTPGVKRRGGVSPLSDTAGSQNWREFRGGLVGRMESGKMPAELNPYKELVNYIAETKRIENMKALSADLETVTLPNGDPAFMTLKDWEAAGRPKNYTPGSKLSGNAGIFSDYAINTEFQNGRLWRGVKNLTDPYERGWFSKINSALKLMKLAWSPFHWVALGINDIAYANNPISSYKNLEHLTDPKDPNGALVREGVVRGGLRLSTSDVAGERVGVQQLMDGISLQDKNWFKGAAYRTKLAVGDVHNYFNHQLWNKMFPASKAASYLVAVKWGEKMGMPHEEAVRAAADTVNRLHGGIPWAELGMSKKFYGGMLNIVLAPDWQISNWSWTLSGQFGHSNTSRLSRQGFIRWAVANYALSQVMNYIGSGHLMQDNKKGRKFSVETTRLTGGKESYVDLPGHMMEWFPVYLGAYNEVADSKHQVKSALGYDPKSVGYYLTNKASALLRPIAEGKTGMVNPGEHAAYGLPTIREWVHGRSYGKWGVPNYSAGAEALNAARTALPIGGENIVRAIGQRNMQGASPIIGSPEFWSSLTGRRFQYANQPHSPKKRGGPSKPSRPR